MTAWSLSHVRLSLGALLVSDTNGDVPWELFGLAAVGALELGCNGVLYSLSSSTAFPHCLESCSFSPKLIQLWVSLVYICWPRNVGRTHTSSFLLRSHTYMQLLGPHKEKKQVFQVEGMQKYSTTSRNVSSKPILSQSYNVNGYREEATTLLKESSKFWSITNTSEAHEVLSALWVVP